MANYISFTRSNYFRVTDPEAFEKIINCVITDGDSLELWERTENGTTYYAFGAYSSICGLRHEAEDVDDDDEFDALFRGNRHTAHMGNHEGLLCERNEASQRRLYRNDIGSTACEGLRNGRMLDFHAGDDFHLPDAAHQYSGFPFLRENRR